MPSTGLPRSNSTRRGHVLSPSSSSSGFSAKGRLGLLERQILQANPILEAFGNAQTQRNNNSSRFGKFIRITFAPDGSIAGANVDWYLLEKSRVCVRNEAERSFHVFYQLLIASDLDLRNKLLLRGSIEDYEFLNKSRREVDGIDDHREWAALTSALDTVGFSPQEQFDLFRIVAAILHIGNIIIGSTRGDDSFLEDPSQAERVCHLLGIPPAQFTEAILRPRALAGREWVTQARTKQQSLEELASLSKTLYEKSFGAIVDRINKALDRPSPKSTFIGVLDIAGFEIFEINSYEQLLINFTNEKLQQFFNHHMFVLEQEEYAREGIKWNYVNFGLDLQPTIDLIEVNSGNTIGILSTLDEECIMPKATDLTFTNKLNAMWGPPPNTNSQDELERHPGRAKYAPTRFEQGFMVQHYAANVEYHTEGWLEKNKDPLNDNLTRVLAASSDKYVASLFADYRESAAPSGSLGVAALKKRGVKKGAFRTVGQRHKEQLSSLMNQLQATQPHFVRCIVPNSLKKPGRIDVPLVLDQLRCNGVLEGIRIARLGYPNRLPFLEFRQRYEILTPGLIPRGYMDGREVCSRIVGSLEEALGLDESMYKIGTSKIFFKAGVLALLEEHRDALLFDVFTKIQAASRMWTARRQMKKILNRAVAIRTIQKNARVYGELRDWPWWKLYTKVRPLLAATRNDEELRRKEQELLLIKERVERDQREKENLENLKMSLESEKRKVEEELESERALALDKDALLERSKNREQELEEEVANLQADLDTADSLIDRLKQHQDENEGKTERMRQMFDQAAEHLVRFEAEQKDWAAKETALNEQLRAVQDELEQVYAQLEEHRKVGEELKNLAFEREEDLARAKERMDISLKELEGKLAVETSNRDLAKDKAEALENEARQAKEQLAEMARTANDYSNMIQKREDRITQLEGELEESHAVQDQVAKEILELKSAIGTISAELQAERDSRSKGEAARSKLQAEMDELRSHLEAKSSEETRRKEVDKSREEELANLRAQVSQGHKDLEEARRLALETQGKLKLDLDNALREQDSLRQAHTSITEKERAAQVELSDLKASVPELEKAKRSLESELQLVRERQTEAQDQLLDAQRTKETLERSLAASQAKYQDIDDVLVDLQREKSSQHRQLADLRKELEAEQAKRTQVEKNLANQKAELVRVKDQNVKMDRELNKTLTDLKQREWEVKQLESKQDKTIVEHVHVLEEAKRVTDGQLKAAQEELQANALYIRSLEKTRTRLTGEAEDLVRQTEKERVELRTRERNLKSLEEKVVLSTADVEKERKAKDIAELAARRSEQQLKTSEARAVELEEELKFVQTSKENLENELERLADETIAPTSMAKIQRDYESRIADLEARLEDAEGQNTTARRLRERVDRQHAEIRQLITSNAPMDSSFQARLLRELQLADEQLDKELSSRSRHPRLSSRSSDIHTYSNVTPTRQASNAHAQNLTPQPRSDNEVNALKQQVQLLEVQVAASERIRRHLELSIKEMTSELDNSDGSKRFLEQYRARLARENAKLAELLQEEAESRRASDAAQIEGVQTIWAKFQKTIDAERESYARLEESRKALVLQQRNAQSELEVQRGQARDLAQAKKQLQEEIASLQEQLAASMTETSNAKRQLQRRIQDEELDVAASSAQSSELRAAIESYKANERSFSERLEASEVARVTAARAEATVKRSLQEAESAITQVEADRKVLKERLQKAEKQAQELQHKLDQEGHDSSELEIMHQNVVAQLEDEREQHQKDLAERDFAADQTRKKYQGELAQLSEELQSQMDTVRKIREENRGLRDEYEKLQFQFDDELLSSGGWKKEKERLENKVTQMQKAYESALGGHSEQQAQIVALHSEVRKLRTVLDDVDAERNLLQKARRTLQAQLEDISQHHMDTSKMTSDREFQTLQLKKLDLERTVEEQEERVSNAVKRMQKAEAHANECQIQLGKMRVEYSELDRHNANLEKQIKELNVKIVDLETKAYASSSRAGTLGRRTDPRVEELANQFGSNSKRDSLLSRSPRDSSKFENAELARTKAKLEDEKRAYESQIASLRQQMDKMQTDETTLHSSKRRAEREAAEYRQRALNLERELERWQNRIDRPSSSPRRS